MNASRWEQRAQLLKDTAPEHALASAELDALVELFATTLRAEAALAVDGGHGAPVSDCGVWAPRMHSAAQRRYAMADRIAHAVFPPAVTAEEKAAARVHYSRLIANLRSRYEQQQQPPPSAATAPPPALATGKPPRKSATKKRAPGLMCQLGAGVHPSVAEPRAMPVDVAPPSEFDEFFEFLRHPERASAFLATASVPAGADDPRAALEFKRGVFYSDGRMDLCKQVVGPRSIAALMDAIRGNPHVQHFLLGNNIIDHAGAEAIAAYIASPHANAIRTWYLAGNALEADGAALLANALATDADATELWLKRNPLKRAGADALARMLQLNTTLVTLDLDITGLLDAGAAAVFAGVAGSPSLRHLHLSGNGLTAASGPVIASYLEALAAADRRGLESLWLDVNHLGDDGLVALAAGVRVYARVGGGLARLSVGSNGATDRGVSAIAAAASQLVHLSVGLAVATNDLGAAANAVSDASVSYLVRLIEAAPRLCSLDLRAHALSPAGLDLVLRAAAAPTPGTLLFIDYGSRGHRPGDRPAERRMKATFRARVRAARGISYTAFVHSAVHPAALRFIRSHVGVEVIDSVYRTQAKAEALHERNRSRRQPRAARAPAGSTVAEPTGAPSSEGAAWRSRLASLLQA